MRPGPSSNNYFLCDGLASTTALFGKLWSLSILSSHSEANKTEQELVIEQRNKDYMKVLLGSDTIYKPRTMLKIVIVTFRLAAVATHHSFLTLTAHTHDMSVRKYCSLEYKFFILRLHVSERQTHSLSIVICPIAFVSFSPCQLQFSLYNDPTHLSQKTATSGLEVYY